MRDFTFSFVVFCMCCVAINAQSSINLDSERADGRSGLAEQYSSIADLEAQVLSAMMANDILGLVGLSIQYRSLETLSKSAHDYSDQLLEEAGNLYAARASALEGLEYDYLKQACEAAKRMDILKMVESKFQLLSSGNKNPEASEALEQNGGTFDKEEKGGFATNPWGARLKVINATRELKLIFIDGEHEFDLLPGKSNEILVGQGLIDLYARCKDGDHFSKRLPYIDEMGEYVWRLTH